MIKTVLFVAGMLVLLVAEMAKVYFIMPFPGSQEGDTIALAYFLHQYIWLFRIVGLAMMVYPAVQFVRSNQVWVKWPALVVLCFWLLVVYLFNFRFLADKMFLQPETKQVVPAAANKVPAAQLVIGVHWNGESRAYPIEIIGYHHQVLDTVGGKPMMITYCTVCRTGRVFAPVIDGRATTFRLVGMDHYNAMFEDDHTGSWWRQVNGEAIAGPLTGTYLPEIPSQQMTLAAWMAAHPDTKVFQPDSLFLSAYEALAQYDEGRMPGRLEGRDSVSWGEKAWVVGLQVNNQARAYDWIELTKVRVVNDVVGSQPLVVVLATDSASFYVYHRVLEADTLSFSLSQSAQHFMDDKTGSMWDWDGTCVDGTLKGKKLTAIQAYQEYWHSWRTFRPQTTRYQLP